MKRERLFFWLVPIVVFVIIAPYTTFLDLAISNLFYQDYRFIDNWITRAIFIYGLIPAWLGAIVGAFLYCASFFSTAWAKYRKTGLILALTLLIGSGVITNGIFKEFWGRARPVQVAEFGGPFTFQPFYKPNFIYNDEPMKSFPSGHASMGFYFLALYIIGRRQNSERLKTLGIFLTIAMGGALSMTRIAMGGHFFSDIMGSAIVMWYTALALDEIIHSR